MLLSAAAEPPRSWAGILALLAAWGVFLVLAPLMRKILNPSPPPPLPTAERVKVQSTVGVTEDEPSEPEVGWWGRIREVGGVRFRQAEQIFKTGSHELPAADDEDEDGDDDPEIDLALEGNDEPPAEEKAQERTETMEEYVARARAIKAPYNRIVRVLVEHYGVSESTAKRRIREVDESRRN